MRRRRTALVRRATRSASGWSLERGRRRSRNIDPWFLAQIAGARRVEERGRRGGPGSARAATRCARSSARASPTGGSRSSIGVDEDSDPRQRVTRSDVRPVYKRVDTCAAEFATSTAYLYSTYEEECEAEPTDRAQDHDPRRRPEPHRPGHRVRLLLRARRARAARRSASRPSWSTAIRRRCRPTTTPPIASTSSR